MDNTYNRVGAACCPVHQHSNSGHATCHSVHQHSAPYHPDPISLSDGSFISGITPSVQSLESMCTSPE
jgi:hypothetical protein